MTYQRGLQLKWTEITLIAHGQSPNHFFYKKDDISTWPESIPAKLEKKPQSVKCSFEYFPKKQECLLTETESGTAEICQPSLLKSQ